MVLSGDAPSSSWRKASVCASASACVEVAALDGRAGFRAGPAGPVIRVSPSAWTELLRRIKAGKLDPPKADGSAGASADRVENGA
ncbi:DUF397 domain-containing protein [Spirillospora albida]|uniref:DUF397 domain-containing protein n=1 Tax=Spirillospora albida TaxID=58123 RepID=UPI000A02AE74|nr:DUF397 domain-containing protein [Spirillospora albida]